MIRALITLLCISTTLLAADRPKGFLTINWGASPEEAKRVMQGRPGVKFPQDADDYKFVLTGGTFAGQSVERWILEFPERKFASATVVIKSEGEGPTKFKEFRTQLIAKYGSATTDKRMKGDKKGPPAERGQTLGSQSIWKFGANLKEKSLVSITCELSPDPEQKGEQAVTIRYVNDTLVNAAIAATAVADKPSATGVKKDEL